MKFGRHARKARRVTTAAEQSQPREASDSATPKQDLADFMVNTSHPTPHCVINAFKWGVRPKYWKRGPGHDPSLSHVCGAQN